MHPDLDAYHYHQSLAEGFAHKAMLENERVNSLARLASEQADLSASESGKYLNEFKQTPVRLIPSFWYARHGVIDHLRHPTDPWNLSEHPFVELAGVGQVTCLATSLFNRFGSRDMLHNFL